MSKPIMNMKPQHFNNSNFIIMIEKNNDGEKKSQIPFRYVNKNNKKTIQIMQKIQKKNCHV